MELPDDLSSVRLKFQQHLRVKKPGIAGMGYARGFLVVGPGKEV